ncbi:DUF1116 domain-containing protein [Thorsellia anophelis]|uniref:DUF1116 domain-containing protein n=1 Tax=Thorsellia anophelis DSM 18579 TaxID=1123402 RepID=A0A1I0CMJ4_9GAMM|nr:DUF1116 domain-containing protein [Thorsellia anophelis]SET20430.1 Protein of unknown function [Thorsellia anophelis DSM 18579]
MTNQNVINLGVDSFIDAFEQNDISHINLDWKPPAQGNTELINILFRLATELVDETGQSLIDIANLEAFNKMKAGQPVLKRVRPAHECIPNMTKTSIFHAGPPIEWRDMCGPMQGAYIGAIKYEGLANTDEEAIALMESGQITYGPNHYNNCVGPMTGMISYSMPLFEVINETYGNKAYCTINEGIGKVMRFGANGPEVIERLHWLEKVLAPALDKALVACGGVNLKNIMSLALTMGDEMHQRNVAASLLFYRQISGELAKVTQGVEEAQAIVEFIAKKNDQFFLNLAMAATKSITDTVRDIPYCTVLTAMSRNGVNFGINVSSLGPEWFTAPCLKPNALYFPGYSEADANPDMGDSAIVECYGIGGMAMGASPAVVRFVGAESVYEAFKYTEQMQQITVGLNNDLPIPTMDFAGVGLGIDIRKVVSTGLLPIINTGVAHKLAGVGQVGAGIVTPPMDIMVDALKAFAARYLK